MASLSDYYLSPTDKAKIKHDSQLGVRVYYYHTDHLGTPQELTNCKGEVVWLGYQRAWGGLFENRCFTKNLDNLEISAELLQPIRFQGQFFDEETHLHYNRFRYYDYDVGMFIQRDPIGLMGGNNVFAYAPNPVEWVDPMGLDDFRNAGRQAREAVQQSSNEPMVTGTGLNGRFRYKYTPNMIDSGYHYYDYYSLPITKDTDANYNKLLKSLNSVGVFPGQKQPYIPPNGQISNVTLPYPIIFGSDHILTTCVCTANSSGRGQGIQNATKEDHFLYPGWVRRTIVSQNGMLVIRTEGEGTGLAPKQNALGVPKLWGQQDEVVIKDFNQSR